MLVPVQHCFFDFKPASFAVVDTCSGLGLCHQVEELVLSELEKLKKSGFTSTAVEAALNSIEFDLRENNTGSFPRGLSLMLRSMSTWIYDKDPFQPLQWTDALEHFKVGATLFTLGLLPIDPSLLLFIYTCSLTLAFATCQLIRLLSTMLLQDRFYLAAKEPHLVYSARVFASRM